MPTDPAAAHPDNRCRHCLTLTASAQPNDEYGHGVLTSLQRGTALSPTDAIRRRGRRRPHRQTRLALHISLFQVDAEGAGI